MPINFNELSDQDKFVYEEIFNWNVYQVQSNEIRGHTILDIGGHYGMFTMLCSRYQPRQIIGVEANPNNYFQYIKNTFDCPNVKAFNAACSHETGKIITIDNEGCCSRVGHGKIPVSTISLEDLVKLVDTKNIVLKMDIEGAEHEVIRKTPTKVFDNIGIIYMELHGPEVSGEGNTIEGLNQYIQSLGYQNAWYGQFFTTSPEGTKTTNDSIVVCKYIR